MSFFRYPGGKKKLRDVICDRIKSMVSRCPVDVEYREPFFGGGGIGIDLISGGHVKKAWINDKDAGVACLWTAVARYPEELKKMVMGFKPSIRAFDRIVVFLTKEHPDWEDADSVRKFGFSKMAIHQISYSGLGLKSGGPLGGREVDTDGRQKSKYPIDCRWSPKYICKKIDEMSRVLGSISVDGCTDYDFGEVISDDSRVSVLYLDPPYYDKGAALYHESFSEEDHIRLAELLRTTRHLWLLSYDDCQEVRGLYDWADITIVKSVNYSITANKVVAETKRVSRWKNEVLISPKGIA